MSRYHEWLEPRAAALDVWATEYLQRLPGRSDGEHPVVAWMRGTALLRFLEALDATEREVFIKALSTRIEEAYPRHADGGVLFPFRRLFIVATRGEEARR